MKLILIGLALLQFVTSQNGGETRDSFFPRLRMSNAEKFLKPKDLSYVPMPRGKMARKMAGIHEMAEKGKEILEKLNEEMRKTMEKVTERAKEEIRKDEERRRAESSRAIKKALERMEKALERMTEDIRKAKERQAMEDETPVLKFNTDNEVATMKYSRKNAISDEVLSIVESTLTDVKKKIDEDIEMGEKISKDIERQMEAAKKIMLGYIQKLRIAEEQGEYTSVTDILEKIAELAGN